MAQLVTLKNPTSPAAEAFRTLRTNILFSALDKPIHSLVITSAGPDEGKSVTAANLAVTMAQAGHTTILVDADLRRPSQHSLWEIPNDKGLTSLVLEGAGANLPVRSVGVENLSVLTSGPLPPNPADLFSTRQIDEVLKMLSERAEFVLFDTPPVLAVTDTPLLASKLDALLLVVKAGTTRRDYAQRAKETLERAHIRIIGVALSNAPRDAGPYYGARS